MPSPSQRRGASFEALAEARLVRDGCRVVARNWRGGGGEIDRVVWDGDVLVFVEIRARANERFGAPALTVDRRKQRRTVAAALAFLQGEGVRPTPMLRFDVVAIVERPGAPPLVERIPGAFDADALEGRGGTSVV